MKKIIAFCLAQALVLLFGTVSARTINVAVASQRSCKVDAVRDAFTAAFPSDAISISSYQVNSYTAEQPVGHKNGLLGARNRLNFLMKNDLKADYYIAIENYIEIFPDKHNGEDRGLVLLCDAEKGKEVITLTAPTFFPKSVLSDHNNLAVEGGLSVTAGSLLAQKYSVSAIDWHQSKMFGGVSRKILLEDALYKALYADILQKTKKKIVYHKDFPKKGVLFADIFSLLKDPVVLKQCAKIYSNRFSRHSIDVVVGLESRGFLFGMLLAAELGVGFVPVRKPGKLPGKIYSVSYKKEYGLDTLTLSQAALKSGQRVLLVDDLIATGGSARAAISLVQKAGAVPVAFVTTLQVPQLAEMRQLALHLFNLID